MPKKKLLIITGAGASFDFGMPTNDEINKLFENKAKARYTLFDNPQETLYSFVMDIIREYIQGTRLSEYLILNFENLLFTIENLSSLLIDQQPKMKGYNHRLTPFVEAVQLPALSYMTHDRIATGHALSQLSSFLIDSLLEEMRKRCNELPQEKYSRKFELLKILFGSLSEQFDWGVVNLNYDNVILSAFPYLETGFDKKSNSFDRKLIYSSEWNFCYHLHGSVHFDMSGDHKRINMHKINWNPNLNSRFSQNSSGRSTQDTGEGISYQTSCIIAGLGKTNKILRDPFFCYYMQLDRLIYEADSILFIGYGFQDDHLNKAFSNVRNDSKVRKIAVIGMENDDQDGLGWRNDLWTHGLAEVTPYDSFNMGRDVIERSQCGYYKFNRMCEKSADSNFPLSVWYNGLLEACHYPDVILKELV